MSAILKSAHSFLLLAALLQLHAAAQKPVLLWSQDLSGNQEFHKRLQEFLGAGTPAPTVDFLNDKQMIVAFHNGVASYGKPIAMPLKFEVVEVEADSGQFGRELSFPVLNDFSQAAVLANGEFLVLAGEFLVRYSRSFQLVGALPVPLPLHGEPTLQSFGSRSNWNPNIGRWKMEIAPSGDTILLEHDVKPLQIELQWLNAYDFREKRRASTGHAWHLLAADDSALDVVPIDGVYRLTDKDPAPLCKMCGAYLLSDELIFLDKVKHYEIVDRSGRTQATGKLSLGASGFARAMHATRFAYGTGAYRGYGLPLITHFPSVHLDVKVFDWGSMKQVADIHLNKKVGAVSIGYSQTALALSPDGQFLAILDDATLNCYRLW